MLKVSNSELISLMKDKKVVQLLDAEQQENKKEEQYRKQMLATLQDVVRSLNKEVTHDELDLTPVVSAIKEVAKAQMELCRMMGKSPARMVKGFRIEREITSEISYISVEYV